MGEQIDGEDGLSGYTDECTHPRTGIEWVVEGWIDRYTGGFTDWMK